jgi:dihydroneopterin aldolase
MDWIVLNDLRFDAIVGILASEQIRAQPLRLRIRLGLPSLDPCADTGHLDRSTNYAAVADQVRFIAQHGRWRLIESMATACARLILAPPAPGEARAPIEVVEIAIAKPTILDGLAVPEAVLERHADWCVLPGTVYDGQSVEVLGTTPLSGAYRITIQPGATWTPPLTVAFKVLAGRVEHDGRTLGPGEDVARFAAPFTTGAQPVTLLAVGHPFL